jgi:hypothetical protein
MSEYNPDLDPLLQKHTKAAPKTSFGNTERRGATRILNNGVRKSIILEKHTADAAEKYAMRNGISFSELVENSLQIVMRS